MQIKTTIKYAVLLFFTIISFSVQGAVTNLIEPVKFFTNHDVQFDNVSNKLLTYNQVGIVGISGIGKTQLARTYAYRNQEIYDIVWFFDCNTDLAEQFLRLAKAINENIIQNDKQKLPENIEIARNAVIEYLTPRKKWLLVFDNLTINRNHRIKDIIKWEHNGHVILCSQDSESLPSPVKMSFFSFKDSIDILIKLMGDIDQNIINELAQIFNGNPVLIVKAALFLKDNQYINIEEYKKVLSKSKNQVQVHIELVLKQLDDSTKDFLNKFALLNNHKLSKNIMEHIVKDKDELTRILYNLSRFGLIEAANEDGRIFEMHDTVKEAILNIAGQNTNHKIINILLDEFNNITPPKEGSLHRYSTISKDEAMISNHEKLLENSEKYKADIYKIMELRKNLMDFYGINKDHPNCKRMTEWLKEKEEKKVFDISLMNNDTKAAYSWYLALMGMYEDSIYFNKAKSVLKQVQDYPRMETGIYDIIALTEIARGNIEAAEEIIPLIEKVNTANLGKVNANRLLYVKSRIFLAKGDYNQSLNYIDRVISAEQELMQHTSGGIYYVLKAEILNNLGEFKNSYQLMNNLYTKEHNKNTNEYLIARILIQLSGSEIRLNKIEDAKQHIILAEKILRNKAENKDIKTAKDIDLGAALVVKGDLMYAKNNFMNSIECYEIAEKIFRNVYKDNFGKVDNISYLLLQGAKASVKLKDKFWYKHFAGALRRHFATEHPRVKELASYKFVD